MVREFTITIDNETGEMFVKTEGMTDRRMFTEDPYDAGERFSRYLEEYCDELWPEEE